jgi:hypothetical protein
MDVSVPPMRLTTIGCAFAAPAVTATETKGVHA